jgi:trans-2,3-dihydro-3-hydroxyanthranilate isomerase
VVGADHNALGAWWWLASGGHLQLSSGAGHFRQQLGERVLPVEIVGNDGRPAAVIMEQAAPRFGTTVTQTGPVANALGLELADVRDNLPTQVVDTGAAHLLVPVRDRETVDRAQPDAAALRNELAVASAQGCYIYSIDSLSLDDVAYTRFFNPTVGIWEDPATGSAAGPLAAFLVAREVVADGATIFIEQGHALGRPSRIQVTVEGHAVRIGGAGVVVAEGMLQL